MKTLTLIRPDDCHLHVRNGTILKTVLPHTARQFARAVIMPNLKPPVTTVTQALLYREEIIQAIPQEMDFTPLMTLYLTDSTSISEIKKAAECEYIHAFKFYPAGATTHSDAGIVDITKRYDLLEALEKYNIPFLVHGEVVDSKCDIFDREKRFIEQYLMTIVQNFPALRIVFEHATTQEAVQFVESESCNIAATITPQHLLFNRNAILSGGIKPHYYCLPVLKREKHRLALLNAATSGNPKFFLGTDSAPHLTHLKENHCGCAGCYSAFSALEFYAEAFEKNNALEQLEGFASFFGADFYGLARNTGTITLEKENWKIPATFDAITPLKAEEILHWKIV